LKSSLIKLGTVMLLPLLLLLLPSLLLRLLLPVCALDFCAHGANMHVACPPFA